MVQYGEFIADRILFWKIEPHLNWRLCNKQRTIPWLPAPKFRNYITWNKKLCSRQPGKYCFLVIFGTVYRLIQNIPSVFEIKTSKPIFWYPQADWFPLKQINILISHARKQQLFEENCHRLSLCSWNVSM